MSRTARIWLQGDMRDKVSDCTDTFTPEVCLLWNLPLLNLIGTISVFLAYSYGPVILSLQVLTRYLINARLTLTRPGPPIGRYLRITLS